MYDDVSVANYPDNPELVAGYVNGSWPTALGLPRRFPGVPLVTIDVNGQRPDADSLDMEWGDATPEMCPRWASQHRVITNRIPVIYCSLSRVQEVLDAFTRAGYDGPYQLWVAHYDVARGPHICDVRCDLPAGAFDKIIATQYASPSNGSTGEFDESLCVAEWPDWS